MALRASEGSHTVAVGAQVLANKAVLSKVLRALCEPPPFELPAVLTVAPTVAALTATQYDFHFPVMLLFFQVRSPPEGFALPTHGLTVAALPSVLRILWRWFVSSPPRVRCRTL